MKKLLLIDACVRGADSRTLRLAQRLVQGCTGGGVELSTVPLASLPLTPLDADALAQRDALSAVGRFSHPSFDLAQQFKQADAVVLAAPFWDLSFPSLLRVYLERLCVCGLTFHYDELGRIQGDCSPRRLAYVTTRGGYCDDSNPATADHAQPYLRSLCAMLGVPRFDCLAAEGLDIRGNDAEALLEAAEAEADKLAANFWNV